MPGITVSTDVIVGFCGETEEQFERTLRLLETVRYDQVFAAAYSPRPGTPATRLADDVPPDVKRRRLNELLALQETIGLARNEAWLGREVEVLVDRHAATLARSRGGDGRRDRARRAASRCPAEPAATSSCTWSVAPTHLGREVTVRIEHAGPYALRGSSHPRNGQPCVDIGAKARRYRGRFRRGCFADRPAGWWCHHGSVRHMVEED